MSARVFLYVQHLLGIGHLKRAAGLARAMAEAGLEVTLASGGPPAPQVDVRGARLVQLPPASAADLGFRTLLDDAGRPVDEAWKARRRDALLGAWRASRADVVLLELFPFGRRQMRFELLPLLEAIAAAPRSPLVASSVRDILGGAKSAERQQEAVDLALRHFDRVLVHGDPRVVRFEETFPPAARLGERLHYTGYVVEPVADAGSDGEGEVLVSAGGGAVGAGLIAAALQAKPRTSLRDRTWRVLTGHNLPEEDFARFASLAAGMPGVLLERSRTDFAARLGRCALSISQAGYNTLLETVQARAKAVVVPFAAGHETEQALRARRFAERGLVEVVEERALDADALARAVDRAAARARPSPGGIDLDGARNSARLVARWAAERAA